MHIPALPPCTPQHGRDTPWGTWDPPRWLLRSTSPPSSGCPCCAGEWALPARGGRGGSGSVERRIQSQPRPAHSCIGKLTKSWARVCVYWKGLTIASRCRARPCVQMRTHSPLSHWAEGTRWSPWGLAVGGWSSASMLGRRRRSGCWAPGGLRRRGPGGPPHSDPGAEQAQWIM